jgi:signal transduction histidine kinase
MFDDRLERAKLDAMKELAYGASHEINNPLANIAARAQTLLRDEADPERRRALEAIHQQAMRAHEMISDLMLFARPPRLVRQPLDVARLLREIQSELQDECLRRNIELSVNAPDELPHLEADAVQLAVAVKAIATNAVEAIGRDGRIEVEVDTRASLDEDDAAVDPAPALWITIRDSGPGIPDDVRRRLFDPFYSGREAGRGLGFGLAKCWRIVTEHGGRIAMENGRAGGAVFAIGLPIQPPAAPSKG